MASLSGDPRRGWHLQLEETDWVLWGYGPRSDHGVVFVDRAVTRIDFSHDAEMSDMGVVEFPFELASPSVASQPAPQEYERVYGWGWRIRSDSFTTETSWYLAASREAAIQAAKEYLERMPERRPSDQARLAMALADVRETRWPPIRSASSLEEAPDLPQI